MCTQITNNLRGAPPPRGYVNDVLIIKMFLSAHKIAKIEHYIERTIIVNKAKNIIYTITMQNSVGFNRDEC